ncbi:tRNA-guanosine34 transglycosylase [Acididesulfobacillus acetoxydans]|uniref:IV_pilin_GFxxxE: prepilin-type N-terminal cleavage/methylation domain n=2 Tax=Acididesulfobacillus acetoxydans TaxID=1561005 RepID=A0A8S0XBS7_9FIRM|nr:tRNA-guanosine34 transglycosylase [Acididesulfobacillus acetoxydans]CEJ07053.1 IV_pilin_GFxxxE: prepilin-type N-terminal cleavage/methylation domain [Acididesulfobacillus acetoxydans]
MDRLNDSGMTLLEVVLAMAVFLIGLTFLIKSDQVVQHYQRESEERQQMMFAAGGQMEKLLQSESVSATKAEQVTQIAIGGRSYSITWDTSTPNSGNPYLKEIKVTITPQGGKPSDVLTLYAYGVGTP